MLTYKFDAKVTASAGVRDLRASVGDRSICRCPDIAQFRVGDARLGQLTRRLPQPCEVADRHIVDPARVREAAPAPSARDVPRRRSHKGSVILHNIDRKPLAPHRSRCTALHGDAIDDCYVACDLGKCSVRKPDGLLTIPS